jgi:hypothetical protein
MTKSENNIARRRAAIAGSKGEKQPLIQFRGVPSNRCAAAWDKPRSNGTLPFLYRFFTAFRFLRWCSPSRTEGKQKRPGAEDAIQRSPFNIQLVMVRPGTGALRRCGVEV